VFVIEENEKKRGVKTVSVRRKREKWRGTERMSVCVSLKKEVNIE